MPVLKWFRAYRERTGSRPAGLMGRLRRDQKGATLALMAASLIPMIGFVGSAVDMSRAYLIKTRLQAACDAGALAARRVMTGSALDANARTQGGNFFNINLKTGAGAYGARNVSFALSDVLQGGLTVGLVHGRATADVPMTLMRVFGQPTIAMVATCEAQLNVSNNDIMFVLDVTGSMSCLPSDSSSTCSSYAGSNIVSYAGGYKTTEKSGSRIAGLRQAVKDFFTTVNAATSTSARLRVGFVPYSSGVRIGPALAGVTNSISTGSTNLYPSRVANFNTAYYVPTAGTPVVSYEYFGGTNATNGTSISQTNCGRYGTNGQTGTFSGFSPNPATSTVNGGGPAPTATTATTYSNNSTAGSDWGYSGSGTTSGTNRRCRRTKSVVTTTYVTRYQFTNWTYNNQSYDMTNYAAGTAVNLVNNATAVTVPTSASYNLQALATVTGVQGATTTPYTWDGCVEERIGTNRDTIDTAPSGTDRWRPTWPALIFARTTDSTSEGPTTTVNTTPSGLNYVMNYSCPKAATRLAIMTQAQVNAYVDATDFVAHGSTYHDIGMIWGTRLMSPAGIFAADHGPAPNGKPVNRHIIFMTDGDMDPDQSAYTTFSVERLMRRMTSAGANDTTHTSVQNTRFLAACAAAKARGISVWVVSFAQALTTQLTTCADSGQAFSATSTAQLQQQFQTIAQRIAELRLTR